MEIIVKGWFMSKEFTSSERIAISTADRCEVVRETEKAMLVKWFTEYGTIQHWLPKSVCEVIDEVENEERFTEGQTVKHDTFGTGTIQDIDGIVATIVFPCGIKNIIVTTQHLTAC